MDLKGFLESSDTLSLSNPDSKGFLYKIPINEKYYVLINTTCEGENAPAKCYDYRIDRTFFQGESDLNDASVKQLYFLYKDGTVVFNQNPIFFRKILGMNSLLITPSPALPPDTEMIDYSIMNADNLCSLEAICGLVAAYPNAMLSFFKDAQRAALGEDEFRENLKLSGVSPKKTLPEALPTFLKSLEVEYKTLTDKKDNNGFIEYLPEYYPYKTECSYMYSIQNIIPKLFYEKEKCLTLNHKVTMFLKEDETSKLYLYNKEKTEKVIDENVLNISGNLVELLGTEAELLPSLDFVKVSDDKQYCIFTLVRDDLDLISPDTTKEQLKRNLEITLKSRIPGVSLVDVNILGGVGEHYLDEEGDTFGQHIIFFVCSPDNENVIIGDSKGSVSTDDHFLRPRMLLLSLRSPPSASLSQPAFSRKTLKKPSRGFHKTKRVRFQE